MTLERVNIAEKMEIYHVKGASISFIQEGRVEFTKDYGLKQSGSNQVVDAYSVFNACSISKFATAVLTLKLISDGVLFLDRNINEQLKSWQVPENRFTQVQKVTLRNLLCHQAGFIDPEGSFGVYNNEGGTPSMIDLLNGKTSYCSEPAGVKYEPNTNCIYSDLGYCIIEVLITDVLGMSFKEVIRKNLYEPLGMNQSWIIEKPLTESSENYAFGHTKAGEPLKMIQTVYPYPAAAGMWCTSSDMAILLTEVYALFNGNGKLGIAQHLVKEMMKPQGCREWSGLGVFLDVSKTNLEVCSFGWGVGFQCLLVGYPIDGTGVVVMTNTDTGVHQLKGFIGDVIESILKG